ncbi:tetratricopeptide repeat protein [Kitasatospora sp. NPDC057542]|uniref:tetratricopeptide repeat protein n=1 Tax=Kitasatospora sp. NPDC057542 TaxID=3346162 RepID=UPI0036764FAF
MNTNTIAGGARVSGPVVQAHRIHGGIHLHQGPENRWVRPDQLPRPAPVFVDRSAEYRTVADTLDAGGIPVLVGAHGVGKAALAARVLRALEQPGGYLVADLQPVPVGRCEAALDVLGGWLRALGAPLVSERLDQAQGLWRTLTAARRPAVLLAGAHDDALAGDLLPAAGCPVVVTAPGHLPGLVPHGGVHVDLGPLPNGDAAVLLVSLARRTPADGEQAALARLVEACAGLPLALGLAAAQLQVDADLSPTMLADTLTRPAPDGESHPVENTVQRALDHAHGMLNTARAAAYRALGALPPVPVDAPLLAAITGTTTPTAAAHLAALERRHLLTHADDGPDGPRYRLPGPGHDHAARLVATLDEADTAAAALLGGVQWWVATAEAAGALASARHALLPPEPAPGPPAFAGPQHAWTWLDAQDPLVRPLLDTAARAGHRTLVWRGALALWPLILRRRDYPLWLWLYRLALDAVRQDATAPPAALREVLNGLAIGLRGVGRHDEALYLLHEALASATGDPHPDATVSLAQHLHDIGATHIEAGRPAAARPPLEEALRLRHELGYERGVALTRIVLAGVQAELGEVRPALALLRQARTALAGEPLEAMRALAWTGHVLTSAGHPLLAGRVLAHAQARAEELRHALWSARLQEWRGLAAEAAGRKAAARRLLQASHAAYTAAASGSDVQRLTRHLERLARPTGPPPR